MEVCIQTHDGVFHADEVLGAEIVKLHFKLLGKTAVLIRSREVNENSQVVFDVGGKADGLRFFDHHQKGGGGMRSNGVPLASAGLLWSHYGRSILLALLVEKEHTDAVFERIDARLIQPVDAVDCGLMASVASDVPSLSFSGAVASLNSLNDGFNQAATLAAIVLEGSIQSAIRFVEGKQIIDDAVQYGLKRNSAVLQLPKFVDGWQQHLIQNPLAADVKYVIYPDVTGSRTQFVAAAVPLELGGKTLRKSFPGMWGGLMNKDLEKESGIAGAVFCHNNLFMCAARTELGALQLALKSLESS